MSAAPARLASHLDSLVEDGHEWLIADEATAENVKALRALAKGRGVRFRYRTGRTMHGTKVITLTLAGGADK